MWKLIADAFTEKTMAILPTPGADVEADEADEAVEEVEQQLDSLLEDAKREFKCV